MASTWARDLPVVTAPRTDTPKRVTLVVPYYENPAFLRVQMDGWLRYPADVARYLSLIVVDDGSPTAPARDVILNGAMPCPLRLFRIEQDVRWNWDAARNIGLHHAEDGWVLVTDMDHVVLPDTLWAVIGGHHDPGVIYGFSRTEHTGESITPHANSWLITREMFWKVGGYDEALAGLYGKDGDWRRRCAAVAPLHILSDVLVRHEYQLDASTTRYARKQPEDVAVKQIVEARGPHWKPQVLSFSYTEEALCCR